MRTHTQIRAFWETVDWGKSNRQIAEESGYRASYVAAMRSQRQRAEPRSKVPLAEFAIDHAEAMRLMRNAGATLASIGELFGVSRQRVDQILSVEKTHARQAVAECLRRGWLHKAKECHECHAVGDVEAHHKNYSEPLAVTWLCRKCHVKTLLGRNGDDNHK